MDDGVGGFSSRGLAGFGLFLIFFLFFVFGVPRFVSEHRLDLDESIIQLVLETTQLGPSEEGTNRLVAASRQIADYVDSVFNGLFVLLGCFFGGIAMLVVELGSHMRKQNSGQKVARDFRDERTSSSKNMIGVLFLFLCAGHIFFVACPIPKPLQPNELSNQVVQISRIFNLGGRLKKKTVFLDSVGKTYSLRGGFPGYEQITDSLKRGEEIHILFQPVSGEVFQVARDGKVIAKFADLNAIRRKDGLLGRVFAAIVALLGAACLLRKFANKRNARVNKKKQDTHRKSGDENSK